MSLAIDVDTITHVLLHDGWHAIHAQSFGLDSYEYLWSGRDGVLVDDLPSDRDPIIMHGGGRAGICSTGFHFTEQEPVSAKKTQLCGPLTAIYAIRRGA